MKTLTVQKFCFAILMANAQIQSEVKWCHKSIAPTLYIFCRLHRRPDWISLLHAFNKHNNPYESKFEHQKKKACSETREYEVGQDRLSEMKWKEGGRMKRERVRLTGWVLQGTVLLRSMKYRFLIILKAAVKWVGGKYLIWKISLH